MKFRFNFSSPPSYSTPHPMKVKLGFSRPKYENEYHYSYI
jgi:hypothetical protein